MADRTQMVDALRVGLSRLDRWLGKHKSLASFPRGATRNRYAVELIKSFEGIDSQEFEEILSDWMVGDLPDQYSVQSVIMALIETKNLRFVETILHCIEQRVIGASTRSRIGDAKSRKHGARNVNHDAEAWWGYAVLFRFEELLPAKSRLYGRISSLISDLRKQTELVS